MRNSWLLIAMALSGFAQTPGEIKAASVQGIVTNSLTGEPVLRAHVTLRGATSAVPNSPPQNYGALTDAEGKFKVTGMAPGGYSAVVEKTGFLMPAENAVGGRGTYVTLLPADNKSDFKLKLIPTGAITGRVLDADGEPMEGITLSATGATSSASGTSDEQGHFRIGGLAPGRYRLCAAPQSLPLPPEIRTDGTKEVHYSATCYPNVLAGKATPAVEVRAGADASAIDIRLMQTPIVRVSGRVSGATAGTRVTILLHQGQGSRGGGSMKPDGTYEIWGVDPGHYGVSAMSMPSGGGAGPMDMQAFPRSAPVEIDVDTGNVDHVDLTLMAPFDISGQIEYEDEEARPPKPPQQRPGMQAQPDTRMTMPRQIMLLDLAGTSFARPVTVAEDGTFKLEKVPPDRYRLNVTWQNAYVRSMRLGPVAMDGALLDVRSGAAGMPLSVRLSSGLADVSGKVEGDPAATAGKYAALIPQETGAQPRFSRSPDGTYSFRVPPGKYLLLLVDETERNAIVQSRNQGLEEYAGRAEKLELKAREKVTKDLK